MSVRHSEEALKPVSSELIKTLVKNRKRFHSFLSRRLDSEAVAEEILQQSLLKAIESESQIEKEKSVVPWFYRILRNALIDYYRSRAAEAKKAEGFLHELEAAEGGTSATPDELGQVICGCLEGLLPTLNPGYAELIRKVDLQGESPEAVAQELGITTNNLWVKLHRARQALRKSLERSCGACSEHACLDCTCH